MPSRQVFFKKLLTRGLGICQKPKGKKNTAGNHDLGWLTEISQRADTVQIIPPSQTLFASGFFFSQLWNSVQYFDLQHFSQQLRRMCILKTLPPLSSKAFFIFVFCSLFGMWILKGVNVFMTKWVEIQALRDDVPLSLPTVFLDLKTIPIHF